MTTVVSLGSNLGDRLGYLRAGLLRLRPSAVSSVWASEPVGGVAQGDFLNIVALCEFDATSVWQRAQQAERAAVRTREIRWGPRTLDVDVVLAAAPVPAELVIPHPRAHQRAFVLAPWLEVDPDAALPQGKVRDLLAVLTLSGVRRTDLVL